jgi:DNA polymerase III alpha subunit (gram-positive type)
MGLLESQIEARNLLQTNPIFMHSKTTGAAEQAEVVEIAILDSAGKPLLDALVKPKRHIRPDATQEHGITDEMVDNAPKWTEVLPEVEEILARKTICVYDLNNELLALQNSYQNNHNRWSLNSGSFVNVMDLFSRYRNVRDPHSGTLMCFSLEEAARSFGIEIEIIAYRRAHEDAWLVRAILLAMAGWKVYY